MGSKRSSLETASVTPTLLKPSLKDSDVAAASDISMKFKAEMPVPSTPLPEIVDFTPEHALIKLETGKKHAKIVLSCSSPLPQVRSEDDANFTWHMLAAFVDAREVSELEIRCLDVSSAKKLNPYSYRCTVPVDAKVPGERSIFLVGVRLQTGTNPVNQHIASLVRETLKVVWSAAVSSMSSKVNSKRPVLFYSPNGHSSGRGADANIRILSQLSEDKFCFQERSPSPCRAYSDASSMETSGRPPKIIAKDFKECGSVGDSQFSPSDVTMRSDESPFPAPPAVMAMVATAMPDFPNPPAQAVFDDNSQIPQVGTAEALETIAADSRERKKPFHPNRKRLLSNGRGVSTGNRGSEFPGNADVTAEAASQWANSRGVSHDDTVGGEVDRHCKIRFVEKLTTVIAGAEDGSESGMAKDDNWSIPSLPDAKCATRGVNSVNNGVAVSSEATESSVSPPMVGSSEGVSADRTKDPTSGLALLEDAELKSMNDEQIDSLLDCLLVRIVESLVEMSANRCELQEELNAPDKSGFTLLHYASLYNLQSLIPVLLSRGANPDTPTVRGNLTPLHLACGAGHWAIAELLVRNGCAINVHDSFGSLPADHATRNGFYEIAKWLADKSAEDKTRREDTSLSISSGTNDCMELERTASDLSENSLGHPVPPVVEEARKGVLNIGEDNTKLLLQAAFSNLSLKDKLALNMLVKRRQLSDKKNAGNTCKAGQVDHPPTITEVASETSTNEMSLTEATESTPVSADIGGIKRGGFTGHQASISESAHGGAYIEGLNETVRIKKEEEDTAQLSGFSSGRRRKSFDQTRQDDELSDSDLDVRSVISESDMESLDIAMRLMNQEELDDLENRSKELDDDLRKWMLRRNYESLKEASLYFEKTLQPQLRKEAARKNGTSFEASGVYDKRSGSCGVEINRQKCAKRALNNVKSQALAGLVIRKNMAELQSAKRGGKTKKPI